MTIRSGLRSVSTILLGAALLAAQSSSAAPKSWSYVSGSSNWNNAVNWGGSLPVALDDVVIDGAEVELTNDTPNLNSLLVTNGATLSVHSPTTNGTTAWGLMVTVTGVITVADGSWVNPYSENTNGGSAWFQCSNLVVDATSGFNANERGYRGALANENGANPPGYGPGRSLGAGYGGAGAGYGGRGGMGSADDGDTYGSYTNPIHPGSGSGGASTHAAGASGGGLIRIIAADSVVMDGSLLANGEDNPRYAAAGSGGGIYVECRTFEGSGTLSAIGGNDLQGWTIRGGGGGGGGRIAVLYDSVAQAALLAQPSVTLNATGGGKYRPGQLYNGTWFTYGGVSWVRMAQARPGSLYLTDAQFLGLDQVQGGELLVPGFTSWSTNTLTVDQGLIAFPTGFSLTVTQNIVIEGPGGIDFSNSAVTIGGDLVIDSDRRGSAYFRGGTAQQLSVGGRIAVTQGWVELCQQGMADSSLDLLAGSIALNDAIFYLNEGSAPAASSELHIGGDVSLTNSATAHFSAGITNGLADYGLLLSVTGDITIATNCWVYPYSDDTNGGSVLLRTSNLTVNGGGGIDARYSGFSGGIYNVQNHRGYGPGAPPGNGGGGYQAGGGYGGMGGGTQAQTGGPTYGSANAPADPGSGGNAGGWGSYAPGGDGGGLIHITAVDTVVIDGSLLADGHDQNHNYSGGGSGGGIYVTCSNFQGTAGGVLYANGGQALGGQSGGNGGGGGGRIAVNYSNSTNDWYGMAQADGGSGKYLSGTNGTIVWLFGGNAPPLVSLTAPPDSSVYAAPADITVTADASDSDGTVTNVVFYQGLTPIGSDTNAPYSILWGSVTAAVYSLTAVAMDDDGAYAQSAAVGVTVTAVEGNTNVWTHSSDGDWNEATKWSLAHAPTSGEIVIITNVTITLTNDATDLAGLVISNNAALAVYAPATNGATAWGLLVSVTGTMTVASNSWINPYSDQTNGGSVWFQCSNLVVDATSGFDANGKGYRDDAVGGYAPGRGPGGSLQRNAGTGGSGHGGYGGDGGHIVDRNSGVGGPGYGSYTNPIAPGSSAARSNGKGGAGGGLIRVLTADSVVMDGSMLANGVAGTGYSGSGSGGGIYVQCTTFEGTGTLAVAGGDNVFNSLGGRNGGAGAGGRIAVVYDTGQQSGVSVQPSLTLNAAGGSRNVTVSSVPLVRLARGRPGSLYLSDDQFFDLGNVQGGAIMVPGFESLTTGTLSLSGGLLAFPTGFSLTVSQDIELSAAGGLDLSNSVVSIGRDLIIDSDERGSAYFRGGEDAALSIGRNLTVDGGWVEIDHQGMTIVFQAVPGDVSIDGGLFYFSGNATNKSSLHVSGKLSATNTSDIYVYSGMTNGTTTTGLLVDVTGDITLAANCWVYPYSDDTNGGSVHFRAANLTVDAGGGIDASEKGFRGGGGAVRDGYGPGASVGGTGGSGGAGYGGEGGWSTPYGGATKPGGPTYGSSNAPADPGSGGSCYVNGPVAGAGGGMIHVEAADTVVVDGSLLADGVYTAGYSSPGSGGGIYISCVNIEGAPTGLLRANGGPGWDKSNNRASGGGGGGRIAVRFIRSTNEWSGTVEADGGTITSPAHDPSYATNGAPGTVVWVFDPPPGGTMIMIR